MRIRQAIDAICSRSCTSSGNICVFLRWILLKSRFIGAFGFGARSAYSQCDIDKEIDDNMKHFQSIAFAAFAGCIGFALLPNLQADEWNKKTTLTVNEPIEVPSCCTPGHTVILQPGEYVMALVDSTSDRHIVRIFDKDQKNVITTILAVPNYRLQPTGKTVLGYWEVPAGQPPALRAWFYPGDNFGQEFAYPKEKAAQIAAFVKVPVPAITVETSAPEDLKTAPLVAANMRLYYGRWLVQGQWFEEALEQLGGLQTADVAAMPLANALQNRPSSSAAN